ncbi:MAG: hypothetical protein Q9160_008232 [Pyrenula sp. 1 TL-2023]
MFLSSRRSRWKSFNIVTLIALVLILIFKSIDEPATQVKSTLNSAQHLQATTTPKQNHPLATAIPEKIWYKLGPRGITPEAREWINSCLNKNPTYSVEYMSDAAADIYVKEKFAHRPDIVEAFLALPLPILKADLFRYLLLLNEGGIYNDLDVSCEDTPIRDWIPARYKHETSLVVGWEFDVGWFDGFVRQLATWTIMARPKSPHIAMMVDDILESLQAKTREHNVAISGLTWAMLGDVVDVTGPRRMTRSIMKSLKATLGDSFDEGSLVGLSEPKLVGDVLFMPGYSFALSSNHYKAEDTQGPTLVTHHFKGSWKNEQGGESVDFVSQ